MVDAVGEHTVLQFNAPSTRSLSAKVQLLVIFNICDSCVHRPTKPSASLALSLAPSSLTAPSISVIPMPFLTPNPRIRYSTALGVTGGSALIHDFYFREVPNPVHLTVDTGFRNGEIFVLNMVDELPNDFEGMEVTTERLLTLRNDVYKYVDDVVEGRVAADNSIGKIQLS
ncbi:putative eukaryotic translation initiation factor 3f, eif3f [Corchorus olitorius]|uniref:Eukaryotic translation initiation factor 3f, eif3f n=1 Tax=Corchorus olitorius TaxID=93759 RepID=A0A1R3H408_9ROSI|nr:putative eukaryotic translation initiation factor 3f, eif3f [Corchorus olitorius]